MVGAKRIKPVVEEVLRDLPETREDYKTLVRKVYERYGLFLTEEQIAKLQKCPTSESITRVARKIWEEGNYLPSKSTQKRRMDEDMKYTKTINKDHVIFTGNTAYIE